MACFCLGRASFEAALRKGDVAAALSYLQDEPLTTACMHFRDGNTLWHVAAASGHLPLLQALADRLTAVWPVPEFAAGPRELQAQHQPHQHEGPSSYWRRTNPFHRFSDGFRRRSPDAFHLPLAAFINAPNLLGQTALMAACKGGHPGCVQFLLSMGANPWYRDRANCTALHYATLHDQGPVIEALLQHPASARPPAGTRQSFVRLVDMPNFCGYTAAHFAAVTNKPRALAALLGCGANIASRCWAEGSDWISGPRGSTPLHLAARRGDVALCKMIMSHYLEVLRDSGAPDPRLHVDARGVRPYQRAAERGSRGLAEMLMPSTPLSYILGTDVVRLYKVPKLKAIASAALQAGLLSQINELELVAMERRRLATAAAVAAARAAVTAATAAHSGGGGASAPASGGGGCGDGINHPAAAGCGGGNVAIGAEPGSLSGTSSFINGALQFVRRQSLRPLDSLRRRLRTSGRGVQAQDGSQHDRAASLRTSTLGGASDTAAGGQVSLSCYDGATVAVGGVSGNRIGSGVYSHFSATQLRSGMPPTDAQGKVSGTTTMTAAAAAGPGTVVEYESGPETAAIATGGSAINGANHGLAGATAAATAGLTTSSAVMVVGKMAAAAALSGGISPVRGNSFDSDSHFPYLPSPPYHLLGLGTDGSRGVAEQLPDVPVGAAAAGAAGCGYVKADLEDPSASPWAALVGGADGRASAGCVAGGSPSNGPQMAIAPFRPSYCPVSLPVLPPPLPQQQQSFMSPFALPSLQATPLDQCFGASPGGGSPRYSSISGVDADIGRSLSGWSPPLPTLLSPPGASLGLQPIQEGHPTRGAVDGGGGGCDGCLAGRVTRRASKYLLSQPLQPSSLPPGGPEEVGGRSPPVLRSRGSGCWHVSGDSVRRWGPHPAAATAGMVGGDRISGGEYYMTGRAVASGCGGVDPAGASPPLGIFQLPGASTVDVAGGGGGYSLGVGMGIGTAASRAGSGRLRVSGAIVMMAGNEAAGGGSGAATAGKLIGSDTSDDYCAVCFERPAFLHIKPCKHALCAECSREVTRMVETQPPSCPFCRGVVHGFVL